MTVSLRKMKFSTLFHSWTASCRLVNKLVTFFTFYIWKIRVVNKPQAFLAKSKFNELCSSIRTEEHINSLHLSMSRNTTNRRMALPYSLPDLLNVIRQMLLYPFKCCKILGHKLSFWDRNSVFAMLFCSIYHYGSLTHRP